MYRSRNADWWNEVGKNIKDKNDLCKNIFDDNEDNELKGNLEKNIDIKFLLNAMQKSKNIAREKVELHAIGKIKSMFEEKKSIQNKEKLKNNGFVENLNKEYISEIEKFAIEYLIIKKRPKIYKNV